MIPGAGGTTLKGTAALVPPAVVTVTLRAPNVAATSTVNLAVMLVELETAKLLGVTPLPSTFTVVAPATKLVPVRVTVGAVPVMPVVGDIDASVGDATPVTLTDT